MRFFRFGFRVAVCLLLLCTLLAGGHVTLAQTQTVSISPAPPAVLAFGVPTGSTKSAEQLVSISVTGSGSVFLSGFSITDNTDFTISSNTCPISPSSLNAPGSCAVGVTFKPSALSGTLENGTLKFNIGDGHFSALLTGALGAIKLFDETDLAKSNNSATTSNPFNYGSTTQSLSCPADGSPTAKLSNTPDGLGNVLEDNFITVKVGVDGTAGNVCPAGITDPVNDCFTHAYQNYAGGGLHNGVNTDSITNANNILPGPGGVPPIDISSQFTFRATQTPVSFQLFDEGGIVAGSTLFLVTNCTPSGTIQPGGTITGNPINPNVPSSLTPQFAFDTAQGNHILFSADYTGIAGSESTTATPTVKDVGISQSAFATLVAHTHAGPAVCLRLNGEVDPTTHEVLCKGFLLECTIGNTTSGGNCPQSMINNLKFLTKYDSPDAPNNGTNYLPDGSGATGSACAHFLLPVAGTCAHGTGPGFLEGNDSWVSSGPPCVFPSGDPLHGAVCPQNSITAFRGAQDPGHTTTTLHGTNSLFIPVVNMPLPTDSVTFPNSNGWMNVLTFPVTFTANPATYSPSGSNPGANGFTPANIKGETYGVTAASAPIPDPDGQNSTDTTIPNGGTCPNTTPVPLTASLTVAAEGIYNLHHYATDCAGTEGLLYQPTAAKLTDPNANWASFEITQFGVDNKAPMVTGCDAPPSPGPGGRYTSNLTINCTVTDQNYSAGVSGSGFGPAVNGIQGSPSKIVPLSTSVPPNTYNPAAFTNSPNICDLAGNCVIVPPLGPFKIDLLPAADLVLIAGSPGSVQTGHNLTYFIVAADFGPSAAQGVTITDKLPPGVLFVSAGYTTGFQSGPCPNVSGTVTCTIGNLPTLFNGGIIFAQITVKVTAPVNSSISNTISISGLNPDPNPSNNSVTRTTKVTNENDK